MTLKKMSLKVLSVFMALIMVVGFCAPAVIAAEHDHEHDHDHDRTVEIVYTEKKARDFLESVMNAFLSDDAFFADYAVTEDSYYLAIGDDVDYAAVLAAKLGLGEDQFGVADWDEVDADMIARADLITVSYSESKISGLVADLMDGKTVELDWASLIGESKVKYVDKALDYIVKAATKDRLADNITVDIPDDETIRANVEAYLYGYAQFTKEYTDLVKLISETNTEATVVLLSNYNAFADHGLEVTVGEIVIDLSDYFTADRQDAVNDYINKFLDKIDELEEGFKGAGDVDAVAYDSGAEIPEGIISASLKDYINDVLKEKPEIKDYIEGNITKEELVQDIISRPGSIGGYIEEIEQESGYTIDVWEETLKDEFKEKIEEEVKEEFGESCTEQEIQRIVDERLNNEWEEEFGQYKEEVDAAVKLKNTYEDTIKAYEDELYDLISDLIKKAEKARGVLVDLNSVLDFKTLINFAAALDPAILEEIDFSIILGEGTGEKIMDAQTKLVEKLEAKLIELGWIEEDTFDVMTLDLLYENLEKLDAKTREWFESFDRATVTKMLAGLVVYSDRVTVLTEKGLEEFNAIYSDIAGTEIVINAESVDIGAAFAAPTSILSLIYAGANENFIYVDISGVQTGLDLIEGDVIAAYAGDTSIANATEEGHAYIADQIYEAIADPGGPIIEDCEHVDENFDHICDNGCGKDDMGECSDSKGDGNHTCDYGDQNLDGTGCRVVHSECEDTPGDRNHDCDECGESMGYEHKPEDFSEVTCIQGSYCMECGMKGEGDALGHLDENRDHICERCDYNKVGAHEDEDKDHACDYGCSVPMGVHEDLNLDHVCDYGCREAIGAHEDVDPADHKCDYCGEVMSGHKFGKWSVTKEATTKEEGERVRVCSICGFEEIGIIARLDGLSTGEIIAIVVASVVVVGGVGFAIYWFGFRKKRLAKKAAAEATKKK